MRGRWPVWLGVLAWLILAGCAETPTPTMAPLPTVRVAVNTPVAGPTPTPPTAPETAMPPTPGPVTPSSFSTALAERSSSWPTVTHPPTRTPVYSAADLQATILARSPDPFTTFLIDGRRALLGYGNNLVILDISDPARPALLGELALQHRVKRIQVVGNTVYLVLEVRGSDSTEIIVQTADITDPSNPETLYSYQPGAGSVDAIVVDGLLHVFGRETTWLVVDISNPAIFIERQTVGEERYLGCTQSGSNISEVRERMGYLHIFVVDCRSGSRVVQVYDISYPLLPMLVGNFYVSDGFAYRDDELVYVFFRSSIWTLDNLRRDRTFVLSSIDLNDSGNELTSGDIILIDEYVYLASSDGLFIVKAEDPAAMTLAHRAYEGVYFSAIEAADEYVYLLDWADGLLILDSTDPKNPVEVGRWQP